MFYANALQAVDLNAGSQVTRSLEKLVGNDIVLKNNDYKIQDVMFGKWIQTFLLKYKPLLSGLMQRQHQCCTHSFFRTVLQFDFTMVQTGDLLYEIQSQTGAFFPAVRPL